ncbi:hypothetical protein LOAG_10385 [Loa loa]|uniref:Uncharacterized protein n=1 Tax=Loa loa TaxID=7209 RepID=A0A1S0TRI7_LOALO|nr:hypothetical protein LOAG_10385 [Loa loa]EFO18113.1 hypothetical protein LOAG_10385 [Loa loa]
MHYAAEFIPISRVSMVYHRISLRFHVRVIHLSTEYHFEIFRLKWEFENPENLSTAEMILNDATWPTTNEKLNNHFVNDILLKDLVENIMKEIQYQWVFRKEDNSCNHEMLQGPSESKKRRVLSTNPFLQMHYQLRRQNERSVFVTVEENRRQREQKGKERERKRRNICKGYILSAN